MAAEKLRELEDAGVRRVMLAFSWGDLSHERAMRSINRFAAEVMPAMASVAPAR
jgi:hypothetical protein